MTTRPHHPRRQSGRSITKREAATGDGKVSQSGEKRKNDDLHRLNDNSVKVRVDKTAGKVETINNAVETIDGIAETIYGPGEMMPDMALGPDEEVVVLQLLSDPYATYDKLSDEIGISRSKVARTVRGLRERGILERVGSRREGFWEVVAGLDLGDASAGQ